MNITSRRETGKLVEIAVGCSSMTNASLLDVFLKNSDIAHSTFANLATVYCVVKVENLDKFNRLLDWIESE